VDNRCALPVKLAKNHRKTLEKFLVNRGMMRVKLAENCKKMWGELDSECQNGPACGFLADISLFALQNDHIFVRMCKQPPSCCLKMFEGWYPFS
jgi:hypothetical protein